MSLMSMLLEQSAEKLLEELKALQNFAQLHIIITHDDVKSLLVHAPLSIKAYIPKKYDGWTVQFIEWNGSIDSEIDTDLEFRFFNN